MRATRWDVLLWVAMTLPSAVTLAREPIFAAVTPAYVMQFPRDHGSHPGFRTEWWYMTGWVRDDSGHERGFQITFFRTRPGLQENNPSRFAPKQILFAHAAVSDPSHGRLRHDQRAARAGFGLAQTNVGDTSVSIGDWRFDRGMDGYVAEIPANTFTLSLRMRPTQPLLLQGDRGFSRKGPKPEQASHYYSAPQLSVSGTIQIESRKLPVSGTAWLDHEWSSEYLAPQAQGWDWAGINFADGGALMAFRIRGKDGSVFWAGGSVRDARGNVHILAPDNVQFTVLKRWRSPRTGAEYPVAMRVRARHMELELEPLMDDQELDSRASTGTVYWEGAVRVRQNDALIGLGYLELTGYVEKLRF